MDAGEKFRGLLRSLEAQYDEDIHLIRCGRRALNRKSPKNLDKSQDEESAQLTPLALPPMATPATARLPQELPRQSSFTDFQEPAEAQAPRGRARRPATEVVASAIADREVSPPRMRAQSHMNHMNKLSQPRPTDLDSDAFRPSLSTVVPSSSVATMRASAATRPSRLRFSEASPERYEEIKPAWRAKAVVEDRSERSPRSSLRSSQSSAEAARHAFPQSSARRTMFFDKSPEEMEAMFQEALNDEAEKEEDMHVRGEDPETARCRLLTHLRAVIETDIFEMLISCLILGNVVVMAAAVQYRGFDIGFALEYPGSTSRADDLWPGAANVLHVLDVFFTLIFFLELLLRLTVYRLAFFKLALNWLDFTVVLFSFMELLAASIPGSSTVLRLVRLAKLARGLRVVRMARIMDSLHLLLKSIGASFSMLLWSMLLLAVIQCTAGMFVGYLVMDFLERASGTVPEDVRRQIYRYYGTFTYTILTMFEVIFANWPIPCRLLVDHVDEWFSLFFIIYRCVVGFCVLNVIGAVFVQQTMKVAADDHELFMQQQTRNAEAYARKIKDVFTKLDTSGEGVIFMDEFVEILNTPTMSHFMTKLELESTDLLSLFKLIDVDDTGHVSLEDFMAGCQRLKGPAKSVDLALLLAHTARLNCKVDNLLQLSGQEAEVGSVDWGYGAAGQRLEQRFAHTLSFRQMGSMEFDPSMPVGSIHSTESREKVASPRAFGFIS